MKKYIILMAAALCLPLMAKDISSTDGAPTANPPGTSGYTSDVDVLIDSEKQALEQARQLLTGGGKPAVQAALQSAVKDMELSQTALEAAKKSPDKLPAAIAAEESAYQALLKAIPREYRMTRSKKSNQSGSSSGQPGQQQLDQLDVTKDDQRYETENQATATPTQQQREQSETVDRLKQLARRQQDLNDRLRDLQTALQEAHTDQEREDVQRQLKRLRDEERQMLSDVDELRQQLEQSPDAAKQTQARQQLEQTHFDVQKAAQALEHQSVSEALAAGARAEQKLQDARENLRQQNSSQFAQQMRQLRTQSHDLAEQEGKISHDLDALNNSTQKSLDDSAQRQKLAEQMARQQSALTNLLGQMRSVTEQSESTEPLLSKQLYDVVRRADQAHTDNQLEVGAQLVTRGFMPQASEAEHAAGQHIDELREGVDRAAESVLGSEADALRYAQKELDDLASQMGREISTKTNSTASAAGKNSRNPSSTNFQANANGRADPNAIAREPSTANGSNAQEGGESNSKPAGKDGKNSGQSKSGKSGQAQQSGTSPSDQNAANGGEQGGANSPGDTSAKEQLRQIAEQLGGQRGGLGQSGPITGGNYLDWSDRLRDVEQALDSPDLRNQLATVRERVGGYRRAYRENGLIPSNDDLQNKVLEPLTLARNWVEQELARAQNDRSLVPLDRDPVQEKYSDLVRKYYEKLGSPQ